MDYIQFGSTGLKLSPLAFGIEFIEQTDETKALAAVGVKIMRWTTTVLTFIVLLAAVMPAAGQERIHIQAALSTWDGADIPEELYGFRSAPEAERAVECILNEAGGLRPTNFLVQAANVPSAAAATFPKGCGNATQPCQRMLLYNPHFMQEIRNNTNNGWSGISIMAHEIGHHLEAHTIRPGGSNPPDELEADEFSGWVLRRLGASMQDAQAVFRTSSATGSSTHPPRDARLAAVAAGWDRANVTGDTSCYSAPKPILPMVQVAGGAFTMGCKAGRDSDCDDREKPAHRVQLGSFEIGKYEVTQEQWEAVMGDNPSYFKGCPQCPVESVSWHDARAFLRKLNDQTGGGYRLPSEAEWEYAARGGQHSRDYQYAGSDNPGSVAWYGDNSGNKTHAVGQKRANELGLHDMSGNVSEWVQDCRHDDYDGAPLDGRAWESEGGGNCEGRVVRGGSWHFEPWFLRAARRGWDTTGHRHDFIGFRVARTLD